MKLHLSPVPAAGYLAALGLLRILSTQRDPDATLHWEDDRAVLETALDETDLVEWFASDYQPSPLLSPWNKGNLFFKSSQLREAFKSAAHRFRAIKETIAAVEGTIAEMGFKAVPDPKKGEKVPFLNELRNRVPNEALWWIDSTLATSEEKLTPAPLLGTGGNDGQAEFSSLYLKQLDRLFDLTTGKPKSKRGEPEDATALLLRSLLFGETYPGLVEKGGSFSLLAPGIGGKNASSVGFESDPFYNPWLVVLALEGTYYLSAVMSRRYDRDSSGQAAYPFAVAASGQGYASADPTDADKDFSRGEIFLPLWSAAVDSDELERLFEEGRATLGDRPIERGTDFIAAVANLGVYRGIDRFVRVGVQKLSGDRYSFVFPLGVFNVPESRRAEPLADRRFRTWLQQFRQVANKDVPRSWLETLDRLESAMLQLSSGAIATLEFLCVLGEVDASLGRSGGKQRIPPIPYLGRVWGHACEDDRTVELCLAVALASRRVRHRWLPVDRDRSVWSEGAKTLWKHRPLTENLLDLLVREDIETRQLQVSHPSPRRSVGLGDIEAWIEGKVDEQRLERLVRGLAILEPEALPQLSGSSEEKPISRLYALVALVDRGRFPPQLLWELHRGDARAAARLAVGRLRADRVPVFDGLVEVLETPGVTQRVGAALAFAIDSYSRDRLSSAIISVKLAK